MMLSGFRCCLRDKVGRENGGKQAGNSESDSNDDDATRASVSSKSSDYYEFLAPSVHHLQTSFIDYILEQENGIFSPDSKIYDIENLRSSEPGLIRKKGLNVVCPIDDKIGASYVHSIEGDDHVGTATHMLSYCWGYTVGDIVNTLVKFCEKRNLDTKKTYVWICCLCNNQHRIAENRNVTFEEFRVIFNTRVRGIGKIISMMAPWNDPGYLKRIWCVFEMFVSYTDESCEVDVVMPSREQESFITSMKAGRDEKGNWGIDKLLTVLASTKVENAQASVESDKTNILRLIEEGPGFNKLNQEVNNLMRIWVRGTMLDGVGEAEASLNESSDDVDSQKRGEVCDLLFYVATYLNKTGENTEAMKLYQRELDIIDSCAVEDDDFKIRKATCYGTIGTGHFYLGEYKKALEVYQQSKLMNEEIFGPDHQRTVTSIFNMGNVQLQCGNLDDALESFKRCVAAYEQMYGESHAYTADSYDYLGRVYEDKKDTDKALELYIKALNVREVCCGQSHPSVATSLNSLALLYYGEGKHEDAIATFNRSISVWETIYGTEHYETATSYFNIGLAYQASKNYDLALDYFTKSKSIREKCFGADHPDTMSAVNLINSVNKAME